MKFEIGDVVWIYRPSRLPGVSKFGHRWQGPATIIDRLGYDTFLVRKEEDQQEWVVFNSLLVAHNDPRHGWKQLADDIEADLDAQEEATEAPGLSVKSEVVVEEPREAIAVDQAEKEPEELFTYAQRLLLQSRLSNGHEQERSAVKSEVKGSALDESEQQENKKSVEDSMKRVLLGVQQEVASASGRMLLSHVRTPNRR